MHLVIALLILFLELIVVLGLLGFICIMLFTAYPFNPKTTPFVPVRTAALKDIVAALKLRPGSVVYDLGCGNAKVLAACFEIQPQAQYIGIDKKLLPYFLAQRRAKKIDKPSNFIIKRADFFEEDISNATHVFMYLMSGVVKALEPRLLATVRPGTRIVSCDFEFATRTPDEVLDLHVTTYSRARKLFVYTV